MRFDAERALEALWVDLRAPRNRRVPPDLILLYGAPCTGKTTLSKQLAPQLDALRTSTDLLRTIFVPSHFSYEQRYARPLNGQLFELLARFIGMALNEGISVVCEAVLIAPSRMHRLFRVAAETSATPYAFFLTAPIEELRTRLAQRQQQGLNSEGHAEQTIEADKLSRLNRQCAPHPGNSRTFDTQLEHASDIVEAIVRIVRPAVGVVDNARDGDPETYLL